MERLRRHKLLLVPGLLAIGLAAIAFATWFLVVRSDAPFSDVIGNDVPPPVSLAEALAKLPPGATPAEYDGGWQIVPGESSFVGYRVVETLASIGANTAVGRTHEIGGALRFDGTKVTNLDVTVDVSTLKSNQARRDYQLEVQGIETEDYPVASFVLTVAIPVDGIPPDGRAVSRVVTGNLTLHGVTRQVELGVEAALQGGLLVVVGSMDVPFADFNIARPHSISVLSIEDHGVMEFQLVFARRG